MGQKSETRGASPDMAHSESLRIPAKPDAFNLPLANTALVVVDMQNSYGSPGGFRDLIVPNRRYVRWSFMDRSPSTSARPQKRSAQHH